MKYLILILTLACSHVVTTPDPIKKPVQVSIPEIPDSSPKPYLTVTSCTNCTPDQWMFIQNANKKLNEVVSSQCFKDEVLKFQFLQGWTLGRNNQEILDSLLGADVKIETEIYYTWKRVLGYTLDGSMKEWLNSRYLVTFGVNELASLLCHESSHKLNYSHQFNYVSGRERTIPYALNQIIETCTKGIP